uniref:Uncharacterized protein n=1 Tax=Aquila chrysaetos chrysaetos TaxID=223781 RepID=A0A663FL94_AQUCH
MGRGTRTWWLWARAWGQSRGLSGQGLPQACVPPRCPHEVPPSPCRTPIKPVTAAPRVPGAGRGHRGLPGRGGNGGWGPGDTQGCRVRARVPPPPKRHPPQRPPIPVVPGKASESDSEPELLGGAAGPPRLKKRRKKNGGARGRSPPPAMAEEMAAIWGGSRGGPSLLQQRLGEGSGRLQGAVGSTLQQSYSTATAATHCLHLARLRLARHDLCAMAATVDIVTTCRLLPKVHRELPAL